MLNLEDYLDAYYQEYIDSSFKYKYEYFGYDDINVFLMDLHFLLNNIYEIKLLPEKTEEKPIRLEQKKFRKEVLEVYNNKCVITNNKYKFECEACHIREVHDQGNYSKYNGLILSKILHETFDQYLWIINPQTYKVEIQDNHESSICNYIGKVVDLPTNKELYKNLEHRYNIFLNKKIDKNKQY
jgi:predicted restriction endonuclease